MLSVLIFTLLYILLLIIIKIMLIILIIIIIIQKQTCTWRDHKYSRPCVGYRQLVAQDPGFRRGIVSEFGDGCGAQSAAGGRGGRVRRCPCSSGGGGSGGSSSRCRSQEFGHTDDRKCLGSQQLFLAAATVVRLRHEDRIKHENKERGWEQGRAHKCSSLQSNAATRHFILYKGHMTV